MKKMSTPFNRWSKDVGEILSFYRRRHFFDIITDIKETTYYVDYCYYSNLLRKITTTKGYTDIETITRIGLWHDFITIHHGKNSDDWIAVLLNNKKNMDTIKQLCHQK